MTKETNTIGSRIRECRKALGLSQEALAELLYVQKNTICRYEKDVQRIMQCALDTYGKLNILVNNAGASTVSYNSAGVAAKPVPLYNINQLLWFTSLCSRV